MTIGFTRGDMEEIQKELMELQAQAEMEEQEIEDMILDICPVTDKLTKEDILNPKLLKEKLKDIKNEKYRSLMYVLFRLSIIAAPKGSFLTLNADKIKKLLNQYS